VVARRREVTFLGLVDKFRRRPRDGLLSLCFPSTYSNSTRLFSQHVWKTRYRYVQLFVARTGSAGGKWLHHLLDQPSSLDSPDLGRTPVSSSTAWSKIRSTVEGKERKREVGTTSGSRSEM
jgi:hypothetical protein